MVKSSMLDKVTTGGHVCFFYESAEERLQLLANYFQEGLAEHELCVFVTPERPAEVIKKFKAFDLDITQAIKDGDLRIFKMDATYVPDGRFAADYMLQNVRNFIEDAKNQGYRGLRTAGEMTWLQQHLDQLQEAMKYEGAVNTLTVDSPKFTGLCLYPVKDSSTQVFIGAMHTHPLFIYDGETRANLYYKATVA